MSQHLRGHEQEQASVVSQQSYRTAQESQLSSDNECTPRASVLNPPEMTDGPERLTFAFYHPPRASIANPPETLDGPESLTFAPHNPPRPFAVGEVSRFLEYISDESNEPKPTRYIRYSGSTGHTLMVNGNGTGNARNSRNIDPEKANETSFGKPVNGEGILFRSMTWWQFPRYPCSSLCSRYCRSYTHPRNGSNGLVFRTGNA